MIDLTQLNAGIENYFNNDDYGNLWNVVEEQRKQLPIYKANVLVRLVDYYADYKSGDKKVNDFLYALRSYLLVFQTSLQLTDTSWIEGNKFGLQKNDEGKVYATLNCPPEINDKFVRQAFGIESVVNKHKASRCRLDFNPFLKKLLNKSFKEFNSEAQKLSLLGILRLPQGFSALTVLPTGGGKSLITQALAYQQEGLTISIVPTISLAQDQEIAAKAAIDRIASQEIMCYSSGSGKLSDIVTLIEQKKLRLLIISPEALIRNKEFAAVIKKANEDHYLKNLVIDEAHIVVEWGDYFRTDYQALEPWRRRLLASNSGLRTVLLSATVNKKTEHLLKGMFSEDNNWVEFRCDKLRREPRYSIIKTGSHLKKKEKLIELIYKLPFPLIVYTERPDRAEKIKNWIREAGFVGVETYTGDTNTRDREDLLIRWKKNEFEIMVATSAFGMGVDKPDVRTVIHEFVPDTPNLFYQELGRGGRDGAPSLSVMCICSEDLDTTGRNKVLTAERALGRWKTMFNSPKSQKRGDYLLIDTKIKPQYNLDFVYDEASPRDVQWNINLLLLFRRHGLIEIVDMDYDIDEDRYTFKIRIVDRRLYANDSSTEHLILEIREDEKKQYYNEFNLIKDSIIHSDTRCISEMFTETYDWVAEYCAGCNVHDYVIADDENRFELHNRLSAIPSIISGEAGYEDSSYFLYGESIENVRKLSGMKIDTIISDSYLPPDCFPAPGLLVLNFYELRKLIEEGENYYLTGNIAIVYSEDPANIRKEFSIIERYLSGCVTAKLVHIMKMDYVVDGVNKRASAFLENNITKDLMER